NRGLAQGVIGNIALLNASIEKDILAKKNGNIKFQVFDLLNQNVNITRSVSSNFITDSRVNRLTQFFMVSFQYRLNKFRGQEKAGTKRKNLF
ncbi:MAG: outer membrane beta-barrel protein, partial [Bacteroidota bacterium]